MVLVASLFPLRKYLVSILDFVYKLIFSKVLMYIDFCNIIFKEIYREILKKVGKLNYLFTIACSTCSELLGTVCKW